MEKNPSYATAMQSTLVAPVFGRATGGVRPLASAGVDASSLGTKPWSPLIT